MSSGANLTDSGIRSDVAWRIVVIANPAVLALDSGALTIQQHDNTARIALEDISVLVLDHPAVTLTSPLLSALADAKVVAITVNSSHTPNGLFLPFLPHSRALKVMRAQLALSRPRAKRLWQRLVERKVKNQAAVLEELGDRNGGSYLNGLSRRVRSGDSDNVEAHAAQFYFRSLFGDSFRRSELRFYNSALNYGYAVLRAAIARSIVSFGFLPAFGIFHRSEQNAFNLADDLLEPYRPLIDGWVKHEYAIEPQCGLRPEQKTEIVGLLGKQLTLSDLSAERGEFTCLAAIDMTVRDLSRVVMSGLSADNVSLPQIQLGFRDASDGRF